MKVENIGVGIDFNLTLKIDEKEARALAELSYYGLYENVVKLINDHYDTKLTKGYQEGLKSFFLNVREKISPKLPEIDNIRKLIVETKKV